MDQNHDPEGDAGRRQRQVIYWRLLAAVNGLTEQARNIEGMTAELVEQLGLPEMVLDPVPAIDTLLQRYPDLRRDFDSLREVCNPEPEGESTAPGGCHAFAAHPGLA